MSSSSSPSQANSEVSRSSSQTSASGRYVPTRFPSSFDSGHGSTSHREGISTTGRFRDGGGGVHGGGGVDSGGGCGGGGCGGGGGGDGCAVGSALPGDGAKAWAMFLASPDSSWDTADEPLSASFSSSAPVPPPNGPSSPGFGFGRDRDRARERAHDGDQERDYTMPASHLAAPRPGSSLNFSRNSSGRSLLEGLGGERAFFGVHDLPHLQAHQPTHSPSTLHAATPTASASAALGGGAGGGGAVSARSPGSGSYGRFQRDRDLQPMHSVVGSHPTSTPSSLAAPNQSMLSLPPPPFPISPHRASTPTTPTPLFPQSRALRSGSTDSPLTLLSSTPLDNAQEPHVLGSIPPPRSSRRPSSTMTTAAAAATRSMHPNAPSPLQSHSAVQLSSHRGAGSPALPLGAAKSRSPRSFSPMAPAPSAHFVFPPAAAVAKVPWPATFLPPLDRSTSPVNGSKGGSSHSPPPSSSAASPTAFSPAKTFSSSTSAAAASSAAGTATSSSVSPTQHKDVDVDSILLASDALPIIAPATMEAMTVHATTWALSHGLLTFATSSPSVTPALSTQPVQASQPTQPSQPSQLLPKRSSPSPRPSSSSALSPSSTASASTTVPTQSSRDQSAASSAPASRRTSGPRSRIPTPTSPVLLVPALGATSAPATLIVTAPPQHARITLLPTLLPRSVFHMAQRAHHHLMLLIAQTASDSAFLMHSLQATMEKEPHVSKLARILRAVDAEGVVHPATLLLQRCDFALLAIAHGHHQGRAHRRTNSSSANFGDASSAGVQGTTSRLQQSAPTSPNPMGTPSSSIFSSPSSETATAASTTSTKSSSTTTYLYQRPSLSTTAADTTVARPPVPAYATSNSVSATANFLGSTAPTATASRTSSWDASIPVPSMVADPSPLQSLPLFLANLDVGMSGCLSGVHGSLMSSLHAHLLSRFPQASFLSTSSVCGAGPSPLFSSDASSSSPLAGVKRPSGLEPPPPSSLPPNEALILTAATIAHALSLYSASFPSTSSSPALLIVEPSLSVPVGGLATSSSASSSSCSSAHSSRHPSFTGSSSTGALNTGASSNGNLSTTGSTGGVSSAPALSTPAASGHVGPNAPPAPACSPSAFPSILESLDLRLLENTLWDRHGVLVVRRSLSALHHRDQRDSCEPARLGEDRALFVSGDGGVGGVEVEIGLVIYRTGMHASDYNDGGDWALRLLLERSRAIKAPSVSVQLACHPAVRSTWALPGFLEARLGSPQAADELRSVLLPPASSCSSSTGAASSVLSRGPPSVASEDRSTERGPAPNSGQMPTRPQNSDTGPTAAAAASAARTKPVRLFDDAPSAPALLGHSALTGSLGDLSESSEACGSAPRSSTTTVGASGGGGDVGESSVADSLPRFVHRTWCVSGGALRRGEATSELSIFGAAMLTAGCGGRVQHAGLLGHSMRSVVHIQSVSQSVGGDGGDGIGDRDVTNPSGPGGGGGGGAGESSEESVVVLDSPWLV